VTDRPNEVASVVRFARTQWPIVLVAVLVGALIGGAWAYLRAPDPGFVGKQRIRVAVGLVGIPNVPTVDSVIAAVSLPDVRESAAASLGVSVAQLGAVTAAIDGKNTSVVVVSSRRPDKEMADRVARAVSEAARARVLAQVDPNIEYQKVTLVEQKARIEILNERLKQVSDQLAAPSLSPAERASFEQALTNIQAQIFTARDKSDLAELQLRQAERYAYLDGDVSVAPGSTGGYVLSGVLRGALVGLLAGLAVAWVRFRSRGSVARG